MRVVQHNIQSLNNKKPLLKSFLLENNIDIYLLNETWLKSSSMPVKFPGYNFINKNAKNEHGGVGILIKNNLKYRILDCPFYEDIQTLAISVDTKTGPISFGCVYCPPKSNRIRISKLRNILHSLPKPCLISGDFNAHHIAFGCDTSKSRGNELYEIFDELDLCILNTGSPTTIQRPNRAASAIDVSCASPAIAPLCEWYVGDDSLGSDHYPTFIDIIVSPFMYKCDDNIEKYLFHKADWSKYYLRSQELTEGFQTDSVDPLNSYNTFCELLNTLKSECIPHYIGKNCSRLIRPPAPWWNDECTEAVKKAKDALLVYRLEYTIASFIEYRKLNAAKKLLLRETRSNSWKALCETLNRYTPIARIWNKVRKFKRMFISKNIYRNDEWIPEFISKICHLPVEENSIVNLCNLFRSESKIAEAAFLLKPFTYDEFCVALNSRKNSTPGLDGFTYDMIKHLHNSSKHVLLDIYNCLWNEQIVPNSWKTQCVIPILKPNKPPNSHNSYRPISLASCIGKLFEQMIKLRLDYFIEKNNILPRFQFGFRKGKSTTDSFVYFVEDIKRCLLSNSVAVCVFLDVQGAYDNVDLHQLISVLHDIGIPGKLLKWIFEFCYDRTVFVRFNNILHGPNKAFKGLMQGACLSPLLYNLYTSQISNYINDDVNILQFADDILVYCINREIVNAQNIVNRALQQLYLYYTNTLKLNMNCQKSSVLVFGTDEPVNVNYNNVNILQTRQQKFLGVVLDDKLKFDRHINYIIQNALKGINIMRCLAGVFWGSDPKILSTIYKSIVRSHFDYSCLAYFNCSPTFLKKLDIIQNTALRIISGAMKTTPINALEAETGIEPLGIRRLTMAQRFCLRTLSQKDSMVLQKLKLPEVLHSSLPDLSYNPSDVKLNRLPVINIIMHKIKKDTQKIHNFAIWPLYDCEYDALVYSSINVDIRKIENKYDFKEQMADKTDLYIVFTDGSKSTLGVKSGYYDPQLKITRTYQIDTNCSIFTAESYAIYRALMYILSVETTNKFIIISDSLSVLLALQKPNLSYKQNYIILKIKLLLFINRNKSIDFKWVPSHQDIEGNEIVDKAVNSTPDEDHSVMLGVPFTDYLAYYKEQMRDLWNRYWNEISQEKGQWYYAIQKELPAKPWYNKLKDVNERKFITVLNRMRFGHCLTPVHLHRFKVVPSKECPHCGYKEADLQHLILECQHFNLQRLILISDLMESTEAVPRHLKDMLANIKTFSAIYKYVNSTIGKL